MTNMNKLQKLLGDVNWSAADDGDVLVGVVEYTPEIATHILDEFNGRNRKLNGATWKKFSSDMFNDVWHEFVGSVDYDINGMLCNGQHRLKAITKSGKSYRFVTVVGLTEEAILVYDTGKSRSASDTAKIGEIPFGTGANIASLKHLISFQGVVVNDEERKENLTRQEELELVNRYGEQANFVVSLLKQRSATIRAAVLAGYLSGTEEGTINRFCDILQNDEVPFDPEESAAVALRKWLKTLKTDIQHRANRRPIYYTVEHCLWKFSNKQSLLSDSVTGNYETERFPVDLVIVV